MGEIYNVKSPAKINVGLRVLSKRKDGYHNIETIFYPVKIYDEIKLNIKKLKSSSKNNFISIRTNSKENLNNQNNICYKAVELFLQEFKKKDKHKIVIKIKKNIPIGAGLGGGSSNAASALKILSKHFGTHNEKNIIRCAQDLGSDVPFFLLGKPAYASSRGEKLKPLPKFRIDYKILIVSPSIHISTKWAYKQLRIKNYKLKIFNNIKNFNPSDKRLMINDFEQAVFKKYHKVKKIKYDMLKLGAIYALMSGSGSAVYGLFTSRKIKAAKKYFSGFGYKTFIS